MGKLFFYNYDRNIWVLIIGVFINTLGFYIALPFMSIYLYANRGLPMSYVGLALMVAAICGGLAQFVSGEMCDRYGRKIILCAGILLHIFSFIVIAYAISVSASYIVFLALLVMWELAGGLYRSIPFIMVADSVNSGEQSKAFGMLNIGMYLGMAIGPAMGGIIIIYSYSLSFVITAILSTICLSISIALLNDTMPRVHKEYIREQKAVSPFHNHHFMLFCIISAMLSVVIAQKLTTLSTYSVSFIHLSEYWVGLLLSLSGVVLVLMQYPIIRISERLGLVTSIIIGAILYSIGYGVLIFFNSFAALLLCLIMITFGELIFTPPSTALAAQMAMPENRGRYITIYRLVGRSGYAFGPLAGGYFMDTFASEIWVMWLIFGLLALMCIPGLIYLKRAIGAIVEFKSSI